MNIQDLLIKHEGLRLKPYTDTVGKLTIGVGRNLTDVGISNDEAMFLLNNDIQTAIAELTNNLPWFTSLDPVRQNVLVDMNFNMGWHTLSTFTTFLGYVQSGDYTSAASDMLNTEWAKQVGARAQEDSQMMLTGQSPDQNASC